MKKQIIIMLFLVSLIFVSGCNIKPNEIKENLNSLKTNTDLLKYFPTIYLQRLSNKCFEYDIIPNYCYEKDMNNWNNKNSAYYKYNDNTYVAWGNSMLPLFQIGTKVAVQKYNLGEELHSCEIIVFESKDGSNFLHRIIGFDGDKVITRGDSNGKSNYEIVTLDKIKERVCEKLG